MNRSLFCRQCGEASMKRGLHPEDKKMGFDYRCCYVSPVVPEGHGINVITADGPNFTPLSSLYCDQCGEQLTGSVAVARTMWRHTVEGTPGPWELEYGTILPAEAVAVLDALTKEQTAKKGQTP